MLASKTQYEEQDGADQGRVGGEGAFRLMAVVAAAASPARV